MATKNHHRRPLTSRPLDLLYFIFFLIHIPATLLLDLQALYPSSLLPPAVAQLPSLYLTFSNDPLIAGAFDLNGPPALWAWFKTFLWIEALFQLPTFFIGARGLYKDSRSPYLKLLLLLYGAATAPTTLACLSTILAAPSTAIPGPSANFSDSTAAATNVIAITSSQRLQLFTSFVPFFVVPLFMALDMGARLASLAAKGLKAEEEKDGKEE